MAVRLVSQKESLVVRLPGPVLLIDEMERYSVDVMGSEFIFKRPTMRGMQRFDRQARTGNVINEDLARDLRLKSCLIDWKTVLDEDGQEIKFDASIVPMLPGSAVKLPIDNAMGQAWPSQGQHTAFGTASVTLRRLTSAEQNVIFARHTRRGVVDRFPAMEDMIKESVQGWQGFYAADDVTDWHEVAYSADHVSLVPQETLSLIFDAIQSHTSQLEDDLGN
jgi:hypothetical protein